MAEAALICAICGFRNKPEDADSRCNSCGAKLSPEMLEEQDYGSRRGGGPLDGFHWKWALISLLVYVGLNVVFLMLLPNVLDTFDPQGLPGFAIAGGVLAGGGLIVGKISPSHVLMEPTVAAIAAMIPTAYYVHSISDHGELNTLANIIMVIVCVMLAFAGSFAGNRLQGRS